MQVLQRIFKFRTCSLDIEEGDERWRWFRPCLLASIQQCTAPCNLRISKEEYRKDIDRLIRVPRRGQGAAARGTEGRNGAAAKELKFEKAARLRDEIKLLETLDRRGDLDTHAQPEVFYIDPEERARRPQESAQARRARRGRSKGSISPTSAAARRSPASCSSSTACRSSPAIAATKSRASQGVDDFRSIHEVIARRYRKLSDEDEVFPDILLIDGGKGQLNAALAAFRDQEITPPTLLSLAKQEEEIYLPGESEPLKLSPPLLRPAPAAIRPRRSPPLRPALPPHPAPEIATRRVTG